MQNRGAIWLFTILLAIACLYQISFSFVTSGFEKDADQFGQVKADSVRLVNPKLGTDEYEKLKGDFSEKYLKDNSGKEVFPVFGYTYAECKEKEISLGLDLQGGMSVTLEVSIPEMVVAMANNSKDVAFNKAINLAKSRQSKSQNDFITEFETAYKEVAPNGKLAAVFHNRDNASKFPRTASNDEIISTLRSEAKIAIDNVERILRNRIDKFGVVQPTIQKQQYSGRILIDLPGVKDKARVRKVLQSTANLEFWETFNNEEIYPKLEAADKTVSEVLYPGVRKAYEEKNKKGETAKDSTSTAKADSTKVDSATTDVENLLGSNDSTKKDSAGVKGKTDEDPAKISPLFHVFRPSVYQDEKGQFKLGEGCMVGSAAVSDTDQVNSIINNPVFLAAMPADLRLLWGSKASENNVVALYAIKNTRDGKALLDGSTIVNAAKDFNLRNEVEVTMQMNTEGARIWADLTKANKGKAIAIVLDNSVQSAPTVINEIPNGRSSISMGGGNRNDQLNDADDLANILKAGALPAPASIVDESIVGPSLGADNINAGIMSFIIALIVIVLYMWFYYSLPGLIADAALIINIFFIIGSLASLQASLTLPGIAGIILTIGIAVDANVLVYERVKEEMAHGKALKEALALGYKRAASAIIDGNLTTLLTAVVLTVFGTGPIRGFATTLIIGILCSLFSAIFITRLIFSSKRLENVNFKFSTRFTENLFKNANFDWVGNRKFYYIISGLVISAGLVSMMTRGFSYGVDFTGGRTYTVAFDEAVAPDKVRTTLAGAFGGAAPEVKTIGAHNQLKITTNYLIEENNEGTDAKVEQALTSGLTQLNDKFEIQESRKVDSTISDDIVQSAVVSVSAALLIIFLYIVLRFRKWQFGLGALASLFHDIFLILSIFSLFHGFLPFSMEIDQHFIAALLTILGYSINDTVVIFDRIREYLANKVGTDQKSIINNALNSTLGRTLNTSFTCFVVMLMIFIFGGDSIKGFVFALMVGIAVGTYSSLCVATPIVVDFGKKGDFVQKA